MLRDRGWGAIRIATGHFNGHAAGAGGNGEGAGGLQGMSK
jgi:hypothetical protein